MEQRKELLYQRSQYSTRNCCILYATNPRHLHNFLEL